MLGSRRTGRVVAVGVVLLLAATACGDDDAVAADPERFCEIDAELEQLGDPLNLPPDEVRDVLPETRDLLEEANQVAPEEIRPSVETVGDGLTVIYDALEAADFDLEQVEPGAIPDELFESEEFPAASDTIDQWIEANCTG